MCKYVVVTEDQWGNIWLTDECESAFNTAEEATSEAERMGDYLEDNPNDLLVVMEMTPVKKLSFKKTWNTIR